MKRYQRYVIQCLFCFTDFDECTSNPCQNGGTCSTPDFNSYACQCAPGFEGDNCQTSEYVHACVCACVRACVLVCATCVHV